MKRRKRYMDIVELRATGDKSSRIRGLVPLYKTGIIFHRRTQSPDLEAELLSFPGGKHDDIIDALAYQLQIVDETLPGDTTEESAKENFDRYQIV